MSYADLINGLYEVAAGFFLLLSCIRLYKDKEIKGWSIITTIFFTTWAYWNIYFYFHLTQKISVIGALFVALFNSIWTGMAIFYTLENKRKKKKKKKKILHG